MRSVAIDKSGRRAKGHITLLDLTDPSNVQLLKDYIFNERYNIVLVHFAPPCGTCSAARKIVRQDLLDSGFDLPKPLRDEHFPMGFPHLQGLDKLKVQQANLLYHAARDLALYCLELGLRVSIENPTNSLFWITDPMEELFKVHFGHHNVFHNCMMGGKRDKSTTWWCDDEFFDSFNVLCSKDHAHAKWTPTIQRGSRLHFPTSEEAEYPELLCERVAMLIKLSLTSRDVLPTETLEQQISKQRTTAVNTVAMGILPRGQKLRPLVSEYQQYIKVCIPVPFDTQRVLSQHPKGARITDRKLVVWGTVRVSSDDADIDTTTYMQAGAADEVKAEVITIGLPRTPQDFLEQALRVGRPRFLPYTASDGVHQLVSENIFSEASCLADKRNSFFRTWLARAQDLADDEKRLHASLSPHVRQVLQGKRILVFRDMLEDLEFPDVHLVDDMIQGFRLTGWMRDSGCFLHLPRPPSLSLDGLKRLNRGLVEAVVKRVQQQATDDLAVAAWEEAKKELERNWIWEDKAVSLCGLVIAHRFGLEQKDKVRVIDNFKQCGLNDTCGLPEKYVLHGVDYIAATLIHGMKIGSGDNKFCLVGKTFDLASAYKQYPLHLEDRQLVRIALKDTDANMCRVFGVNALPFGATGSVAGFLRISSALFYILTKGLRIWASAFFDDFPTLSAAELSALTDQHVAMLFDLLGIEFAREGKKFTEFGSRMKALGLVFDLSHFAEGRVYIKRTDERKAELVSRIDDILSADELTSKEAESLRGRLHWYESYLFGRTANLAIHKIGKRISAPSWVTSLGAELESALRQLRDRVLCGPPLMLSADMETPILIFTDGACEGDDFKLGSVGGVIYHGSTTPLRFFSSKVPDRLMAFFLEEAKNPIYLFEMLACYIALRLWGPDYVGRYVVYYLDNEASRGAFIKGYSGTKLGNVLVQLLVSAEDACQWKAWYGRVPTSSNNADAPSRFQTESLRRAGATCDGIAWDEVILAFEHQLHLLVG